MASITFGNPKSNSDRDNRDALLAASLRDAPLAWSYSSEYPLVLTPSADHTSWCAFDGDELVAHANLWPRKLQHVSGSRSLPVGLVGNVATHPNHRGQGHMSTLINHLAKSAASQGLHTLVLWSDLFKFYQNLGFTSIGREWRHRITRDDRPKQTGMTQVMPNQLDARDVKDMMNLRPKLEWTLGRSEEEFRTLLGIPDTHLFARRRGQRIQSWLIIGKGSDMHGVIHEWGSLSPVELMADIQSILHGLQISELLLLTPGHLHPHWLTPLRQHASESTDHAMALGLPIGPHGKDALSALARSFIWGLDSI